ncbi:MAG TPA: hypothetical protein PLZ99_03000 [Parcubacteria group bacterium]|jgi:predicted GH43/DUF377 family glycosyl hydrolase|nr:hypothetical protein [Parcubacteria group bacterium]
MFVVRRSKNNPILEPNQDNSWENYAVFNGNPIEVKGGMVMVYRAQSTPERIEDKTFSLSVIGKAESKDGVNFKNREVFIAPEHPWERYGCEDPRVTKIDGKYYCFYTALSAFPLNIPEGIRVGLAISRDMKTVSEKHLITPFNAKAMTLFPEKINGKYVALLTVNPDLLPTHMAIAEFKKLEDMWDEKYWNKWYKELNKHIFIHGDDIDRIEIGSCPIKTERGWLLVTCRIQNHSSSNRVFAIEALLLDLKDPKKIIGKTRGALVVPEEPYEINGTIRDTIFPSGAMIKGEDLCIYYGATDTTIALAKVNLEKLLDVMEYPYREIGFHRIGEGALMKPRKNVPWESKAIFNPAAIDIDGVARILYRAMGEDNTSVVGYAESVNATDISYIHDKPVYVPRESFEMKGVPNGNSGCEDPRLVKMGSNIYMYYTAYNGITPPAVAVSSIKEKDLKNKKWKWSKPSLVTADGVDDKDACLHPEKVNGKYMLYHRVHNYICVDFGSSPEFPERNSFKNIPLIKARKGMWDSVKVGLSVPPIKTNKGWILLYHGVSGRSRYRIGALLLDLKDPSKVLARTTDPVFEPREAYEIEGQVNYVVFPCGAVERNGYIFMYYGGADSVVDVASVSLKKLLDVLTEK